MPAVRSVEQLCLRAPRASGFSGRSSCPARLLDLFTAHRLLHVLFVFLTPSPQLVFLSVFATKNVEEIKSVLKLSRILRSKNSTLNHLSCLQADKHSRPLSLRSALLITSSSDGGVCRGCERRFLPSWASSFREALYRSNREESKKL